jgi:hypothetical protein
MNPAWANFEAEMSECGHEAKVARRADSWGSVTPVKNKNGGCARAGKYNKKTEAAALAS